MMDHAVQGACPCMGQSLASDDQPAIAGDIDPVGRGASPTNQPRRRHTLRDPLSGRFMRRPRVWLGMGQQQWSLLAAISVALGLASYEVVLHAPTWWLW